MSETYNVTAIEQSFAYNMDIVDRNYFIEGGRAILRKVLTLTSARAIRKNTDKFNCTEMLFVKYAGRLDTLVETTNKRRAGVPAHLKKIIRNDVQLHNFIGCSMPIRTNTKRAIQVTAVYPLYVFYETKSQSMYFEVDVKVLTHGQLRKWSTTTTHGNSLKLLSRSEVTPDHQYASNVARALGESSTRRIAFGCVLPPITQGTISHSPSITVPPPPSRTTRATRNMSGPVRKNGAQQLHFRIFNDQNIQHINEEQ